MPPLITVGSSFPASSKVSATRNVVLPCVPAMARDAVLEAHELGQHFRAAHDGQAFFSGGDEFKVNGA